MDTLLIRKPIEKFRMLKVVVIEKGIIMNQTKRVNLIMSRKTDMIIYQIIRYVTTNDKNDINCAKKISCLCKMCRKTQTGKQKIDWGRPNIKSRSSILPTTHSPLKGCCEYDDLTRFIRKKVHASHLT